MKQLIEQLIAQNNLEQAIEQLFSVYSVCIKHNKDDEISTNYNSLIMISGKLQGVLQDQKTGVIRLEDAYIAKAQIRNGLLSEINSLPDNVFETARVSLNTKEDKSNTENLTLREQIVLSQNKTYKYDIFLSFSSKDIFWVKDICNELRGYGLRVFFSDDNLRLKAGASFFGTIDDALITSKNFILVCTPNSMQSEYVRDEYETFYQEYTMRDRTNRIFIIYAGAKDFRIDLVPIRFRRFQMAFSVSELVDTFIEKEQLNNERFKKEEINIENIIEKHAATLHAISQKQKKTNEQNTENDLAERKRKAKAEADEKIKQLQQIEEEEQKKIENGEKKKAEEEKTKIEQEKLKIEKEKLEKAEREKLKIENEKNKKLLEESNLWEKTRKINTIDTYARFLKTYPSGQFSQLAKQYFDILKTQSDKQKEELEELNFWEKANQTNNLEVYNQYLKKYPKGQFVEQTKQFIEILKPKKDANLLGSSKNSEKLKYNKLKIIIPVSLAVVLVIVLSIVFGDKIKSISWTTDTFTDSRDGNIYKWVTIGTQTFMSENLKYLPEVCESTKDCGYWVYGYEGTSTTSAKATEYYQTYGVLYNYETAKDICPSGWHLPTKEEFETLIADIDGSGSTLSANLQSKASFSALFGGYRHGTGGFFNAGRATDFWLYTLYDKDIAYVLDMYGNGAGLNFYGKQMGFSVRCFRD